MAHIIWVNTYSVIRTAKLLFPPATSYHPISCRNIDWKNLIRMRVIWRNAVWLKQSTANIPATKCNADPNANNIPYETESFLISAWFTSSVALVLLKKKQFKTNDHIRQGIFYFTHTKCFHLQIMEENKFLSWCQYPKFFQLAMLWIHHR